MLTVTDKAVQYVRETLKKKSAPGAVRIEKAEKGYRFILDEPKDGDQPLALIWLAFRHRLLREILSDEAARRAPIAGSTSLS